MLKATSVSDGDNASNNLHLAGTDVTMVNKDVVLNSDYDGLESANFDEEISTIAGINGHYVQLNFHKVFACLLHINCFRANVDFYFHLN